MKKGYTSNIEQLTIENTSFRKVLYSGEHMQLVLMSLRPNEDIGMEVHTENDQFFRVEAGTGKCVINGNEYALKDGTVIIVPSGAEHNVINTSDSEDLKLYTIYSPAHHKDGIERATKEEAMVNEAEFDGVTTE
ncbi:MAG: hypothetical protein RLY57_266 [Candidatus Parcubacteria bacterium]|jgi:mannose-6-phosphate isomerase-like protein (cupin superfamily)